MKALKIPIHVKMTLNLFFFGLILLILGNIRLSVRPSVRHRVSRWLMLTIREILESLSWVLGKVAGDRG